MDKGDDWDPIESVKVLEILEPSFPLNTTVWKTIFSFRRIRWKEHLSSLMSGSSHNRITEMSSNFGCLFTFFYLDGANSIKTDLHICNLQTGQSISYNYVNQFWLNLPQLNNKKK